MGSILSLLWTPLFLAAAKFPKQVFYFAIYYSKQDAMDEFGYISSCEGRGGNCLKIIYTSSSGWYLCKMKTCSMVIFILQPGLYGGDIRLLKSHHGIVSRLKQGVLMWMPSLQWLLFRCIYCPTFSFGTALWDWCNESIITQNLTKGHFINYFFQHWD